MHHDVALHDVIGRHQAYIQRKKDLFIYAHRILHLAKTTRVSRNARALRARRDYKLSLLAAARFGRIIDFILISS